MINLVQSEQLRKKVDVKILVIGPTEIKIDSSTKALHDLKSHMDFGKLAFLFSQIHKIRAQFEFLKNHL